MADERQPKSTFRTGVLPFPGRGRPRSQRREVAWLPSGRSLVAGFVVLAVAAGTFLAARETAMFALRTVEVRGARPEVAARVRTTLEPLLGTSLVTFDEVKADRLLVGLPDVAAATYDRDFPHTLRVFVRVEDGVAVLRQGADAWLASRRARVLARLTQGSFPTLPRVWLAASASVEVGQTLDGAPARAVRTLAVVRRLVFPAAVQKARADDEELTLVLRSGVEIRLGDTADLPLKLAIARRIVPLAQGARYVDVSVPERSVAGFDAQVSS
jgi:cell division protein FtsQ